MFLLKIRTVSNVLENLFVLARPTKRPKAVRLRIPALKTLVCVLLFVTQKSPPMPVFPFFALDQDSLPILFVRRLMSVNIRLLVSTRFGWLMIVSKGMFVVLRVFVGTIVGS